MPDNQQELAIKQEIKSYLEKTAFDDIQLSKKEKKPGQTTMTRKLLLEAINDLKKDLPKNSPETLATLNTLQTTIQNLPLSKSVTDIIKSLWSMESIIKNINSTLDTLFKNIKDENIQLDNTENKPFDKVMKSTRFFLYCVQCILESIPSLLAGRQIRGSKENLAKLQTELKDIYHSEFMPKDKSTEEETSKARASMK